MKDGKIKNLIIEKAPHIYVLLLNYRMQKKIQMIKELEQIPETEYPEHVKRLYRERLHRELNLISPQSYTEKLQWLKLYDSTMEKSNWADKIIAKKLVADRIGPEYVIPMIAGPYNTFDEILFTNLPEKFVLKTNHGSGTVCVVKDKNKFLHSSDFYVSRAKFNAWMKINYAFDDGFELHYQNIIPAIFAEEYIEPREGGSMLEYRFYCFDGEPYYCDIQRRISSTLFSRNMYDMNWNHLDVTFGVGHCIKTEAEPIPEDFDEMKRIARVLSAGFPTVRVDLNHLSDRILFGEMTFTGSSGFMQIDPANFDYEMGKLLKLPI
jgi:hypothetical protein